MSAIILHNKKVKSYEFNRNGLEQLKKDEIKKKSNLVGDCIFYSSITVMLGFGIIGISGLINMGLCMGTSKSIKWLCRNGII